MLVFLICAALGVVGIVFGGGSFWFAHASTSWPSTTGRIVASVLDVERDTNGKREESAEIAYEYTVGGATFVRSQINGGVELSWSTSVPGISGARDTLEELPIDAEVKVYYWPSYPGFSCLHPGKYAGGVFLIVISVIVMVAGYFLGGA
jgi:hypothetical protein